MKKVFIALRKGNALERLSQIEVAKMVKKFQLEVVGDKELADIVMQETSSKNGLRYQTRPDEKKILFTVNGDGMKMFRRTSSKKGNVFFKGTIEGVRTASPITTEEDKRNTEEIIDYLLGRKDEIQIKDVLAQDTWNVLGILNKRSLMESDKETLMSRFDIEEKELKSLLEIVKAQTTFESSKLSDIMRKVKTFHMLNKLVPNVGDSLISNLIKANTKWNIANHHNIKAYRLAKAGNTKAAEMEKEKVSNCIEQIEEEFAKAKKTVRLSMQGSKAFNKFAKEGYENKGLYSLYVPEPTLGDDEVMIPHPDTIKGSGEDYPKIGEVIMDVRHPITTIMLGLKVKGYTLDGSIRTSVRVCLAYYGDADGDAHSASWSKWSKFLVKSDTTDLDRFCDAAEIKVDETKEFTVSLDEITGMLSDETCVKKLAGDGLAQATAKKITKGVTGAFGAVERNFVFNTVCNKWDTKMSDMYKVIHAKSWLSQIPVQAKNLLEDLREGKIDQMTKDTIMLFEAMSKDTVTASYAIGTLLGMTTQEALEYIKELKGVTSKFRGNTKVEQKELDVAELFMNKF